jgi:hypothetical protein
VDLREDYMKETLANMYALWTRPVWLRTVYEGEGKLVSYDGKDYNEKDVEEL